MAVALLHLIYTGYLYSLQFEIGGKWEKYAPGLRPGWLFGRRIDLSDTQWREFRNAVPALASVLVLFAVLSRVVQRQSAGQGDAAIRARALFIVGFAALFMGYLHGLTTVYVFGLVAGNWALAQTVAGSRFG